MRMYALAGFDVHPCIGCGGILDRSAIPGALRARETDDAEQAGALARPVRGAAYAAADLHLQLTRPNTGLLVIPGEGVAMHTEGSPSFLAAATEEAAIDLLWSCLAAAPRGGTVNVDFISAGQDWALRAALSARLALSPDGPFYTRGELGPLRPWLPSGALL
jgi:hypothetical protein